jgi:subtilisin family serine protease
MRSYRRSKRIALGSVLGLGIILSAAASAQTTANRYVVTVRSGADYAAVRAALIRSGTKVLTDLREIGMLVVTAPPGTTAAMESTPGIEDVVPDHAIGLNPPDRVPWRKLDSPGLRSARPVSLPGSAAAEAIRPDPAFGYKGLQWNYLRIGLPEGWRTTAGSPAITVGVADTGVDFTHPELAPAVIRVQDFTSDDQPSACKAFVGKDAPTDEDLAKRFGGPVTTDWNGHGSWIAGNIAAALNEQGINGIAPEVKLVSLKISENCGTTYLSNIIDAFVWAASNRLDIVSISFGGYLDRSKPEEDLLYREFAEAVEFARSRGTLIVAAAGNEHVRIGAGGEVLSHGRLTTPGQPLVDLFGLYEVPGGAPGVVNVSATGNQVVPSSGRCPDGTTGNITDNGITATCKPRSDRHQALGQGLPDQLAYYSNYGPRIDIAAPGGARKFNLPAADRGGTPGFPYVTTDATNVWEEFSVTSNFATEIPCFVFTEGSGFPQGACYTSIQGTSMATPHVSAALALIASQRPELRHDPDGLVTVLKSQARPAHNQTQILSATDRSPGDLTRQPCRDGYCHLGGPAVPDAEAYGAGIIDVSP